MAELVQDLFKQCSSKFSFLEFENNENLCKISVENLIFLKQRDQFLEAIASLEVIFSLTHSVTHVFSTLSYRPL